MKAPGRGVGKGVSKGCLSLFAEDANPNPNPNLNLNLTSTLTLTLTVILILVSMFVSQISGLPLVASHIHILYTSHRTY